MRGKCPGRVCPKKRKIRRKIRIRKRIKSKSRIKSRRQAAPTASAS
jgi:hypothetical protein